MNLEQYNALEGDTKLAAALAIACGWQHIKAFGKYEIRVAYDDDFFHQGVRLISWMRFDPFNDASITYGLLDSARELLLERRYTSNHWWVAFHRADGSIISRTSKSKTHAIVQAYIAADPMGHLAKFLKGE
jgi:hypothetical protein